ncbi:MAG: cobyric acid synthase [Nitrospirae bacterium]|nr:MAG: cobyric acid synthase [Nitrospirota bacterium]
MAKSLMITGTGSGAGKSLIVTGLCRIFSDMGMNVAPFKAQNMALNSYITADGGEIGRAQALQAEGARIPVTVEMNPVLLKASGEMGSQVMLMGRPLRHMKAQEYYAFKKEAWEVVTSAYDSLSSKHDLIVMEGAGSPAEINLMDVDIVNMSAARYAKAPVLLVGDIDKGGVFASLFGTVKLLGREGRNIKGFIINKFRGDIEILRPGLDMIKEKTGKPVLGVLPYITDIGLPEEDGLFFSQQSAVSSQQSKGESIKIVIVKLKYISNFTDFDPLAHEPDVDMVYSTNPTDIENADIVIVPGSKNTVKDLLYLRERKLDQSIKTAYANGIQIIGMCGGYQMLGRKIYDADGVESGHKEIDGIGLLDIETTFKNTKTTCRVEAEIVQGPEFGVQSSGNVILKGYEIHMGESSGDIGLFKISRLPAADSQLTFDGSMKGNCWGTYLHGIFENDDLRRGVLNLARKKKGLSPLGVVFTYAEAKDRAIDSLAQALKENLDMDFIKRLLKL